MTLLPDSATRGTAPHSSLPDGGNDDISDDEIAQAMQMSLEACEPDDADPYLALSR